MQLPLTLVSKPSDFVDTDMRGRDENTRQMLFKIDSRHKGGIEITAVVSVHTSGNRMVVGRKTLESAEAVAAGKRRTVGTLTFFRDTWIDSDGAWLLSRSRAEAIETYVNGRRVSHTKSAGGSGR